MNPQLLFAGQGGGAWGCFPAGALFQYTQSGGQAYDGGFGVSVNALHVAKLFASDDGTIPEGTLQKRNIEELRDFWFDLKGNESVYKPWPKKRLSTMALSAAISPFKLDKKIKHALIALLEKKASIYDNAPLEKLLRDHLSGKKWHPSVKVGVVDYQTAEFKEISLGNNPQWVEAVLASTAIPVAFPPQAMMWDGGVMDMTPLKGVFKRFKEMREANPGLPQELHVYRTSPFPTHRHTGRSYDDLPKVAWRTIQIMNANSDEEDFSNTLFYNELSGVLDEAERSTDAVLRNKLKSKYARYGKVAIYVISPSRDRHEQDLPPDAYTFDPAKIRSGFALGQEVMRDFLAHKEKYRLENLLEG